jgi:uncharacterized protein
LAAQAGATEPRHSGSLIAEWRGLGVFWLVVALLVGAGAVTLQVLGPPSAQPALPVATEAPSRPAPPPPPVVQQFPKPGPQTEAPPPQRPGRDTPGPIADPDPALLEPVGGAPSNPLPRIAADGRMPMQVYAAGFDGSTRRPRVGLLLAGVGLNQAESEVAVRSLPGGITLAFSPYSQNLAKLLGFARSAEHEYLLSIPMEPQGFSLNDPGPQALMTNLPPEQNRKRLQWALSRLAGYVGTTGALGRLRGERFASMSEEMQPVLAEIAQRGLLYVDPRPGATPLPLVWSRPVDLVVDEPEAPADIDDKLAQLTRLAREKGSALGLATAVRPATIARIATWANGLQANGLVLAPVSALVRAPK